MFLFATLCCLVLAIIRLIRAEKTVSAWCFAGGMLAFALESLAQWFAFEGRPWGAPASFAVQMIFPATWLAFSLTYSRGNGREFLRRWRLPLLLAGLLPLVYLAIAPSIAWPPVSGSAGQHFEIPRALKQLNVALLIFTVFILMNLEQTFRATVGTLRWRIKFALLGFAVIFAVRIYTYTQALLFSAGSQALAQLNAVALVLGCGFIGLAYARSGFAEIDVYPSQAALRTSLTVILVGTYLLLVGVLAQAIAAFGGVESFQLQATFVLVAVSILAVLLLSDRLRQRIRLFVASNFKKARHDSLQIWTKASRELGSVKGRSAYCSTMARLIADTFQTLSVSLWLCEEEGGITLVASTVESGFDRGEKAITLPAKSLEGLLAWGSRPCALHTADPPWAGALAGLLRADQSSSSMLYVLPLISCGKLLGLTLLQDRVNFTPYTIEEFELLQCLGEQCAAGLLNLRLTDDLVQARELEAFQAMSAFFVHDLKNAASTLTLMLRNLPIHFNDPEFRQDALRGIGRTTDRINELVERLSLFRGTLELQRASMDLSKLVGETLDGLEQLRSVTVVRDLGPTPRIRGDAAQLQSVITNLLLNAREATPDSGEIRITTGAHDGSARISVADTGCGMSAAFIRDRLFRPFSSTKSKGLGIGMFHSRMIVTAHEGTLQVRSEPGKGTTFMVSLPTEAARTPEGA